ncbi:MAG: hypothetical protein CR974_03890 [Gammaproteobacteria bacterium]|nr:MAG: hypothetical protein CR974_03890 [Gammaproteobacteria bacterium]
MTDIAKAFENFFADERRSIATILSDYGNGHYEAQTETGHKLILLGNANVGDKVFYGVESKRILEQAPNIPFVEILV